MKINLNETTPITNEADRNNLLPSPKKPRRSKYKAAAKSDNIGQKHNGIFLDGAFKTFIISLFIILGFYAFYKAFPFGDRQIFRVDQYYQYVPFLSELRRSLLSGQNILYSWRHGLGVNFWGEMAYYCMSPFNLLLLLFPENSLAEGMLLITVLKIACSAATMQVFLQEAYLRSDRRLSLNKKQQGITFSIGLSVAYSLCNYVMAYSWNNMWLDGLICLPLIALGVFYLVRQQHSTFYSLMLALALISNFYITGMICIFLPLYFIVSWSRFTRQRTWRSLLRSLGDMLLASLIGLALAMFVLLPTYLMLKNTSASSDLFPQTWDFMANAAKHLAQFSIFRKPQIMFNEPGEVSLANLYSTALVILGLALFFTAQKISKLARVAAGAVWGLLFLALNLNSFNFLMHGMHYPNSLDYRYAFLIVFLCLSFSFDGILNTQGIKANEIVLTGMSYLLILIVLQTQEQVSGQTLFVMIFLLVTYTLLLTAYQRLSLPLPIGEKVNLLTRRNKQQMLAFLITGVVLAECLGNVAFAFKENDKVMPFGPKDGYAVGEFPDQLRQCLAEIQQREEVQNFSRMELIYNNTINDGALYGFNGLSSFSSTYPHATIKLFSALGYDGNRINSVVYHGSNIFYDSVLGIKYLVRRTDSDPLTDQKRELINTLPQLQLWQNPEALSIGFFVPGSCDSVELPESGDPLSAFEMFSHPLIGDTMIYEPIVGQNIRSLGKEHVDLSSGLPMDFTEQGISSEEAIETADTESKSYTITKGDNYFSFEVPESGDYLLTWMIDNQKLTNISVNYDEKITYFTGEYRGMASLEHLPGGKFIEINANVSTEETGSLTLRLAKLNEDQYGEAMGQLQQGQLKLDHFANNHFDGSFQASTDGQLFLSIPYENGWSFWIDGKAVEAKPAFGGLTTIPGVTAGEHQFTAHYLPAGCQIGCIITAIGAVALLINYWRQHRERPAKQVKVDQTF